jgi:hypothetical protein
MYEDRRKIMKVCQECLGQGHKGLIKVEGEQLYDRCDCNVPITKQINEWEQRYDLCHRFYKMSLDKYRDKSIPRG